MWQNNAHIKSNERKFSMQARRIALLTKMKERATSIGIDANNNPVLKLLGTELQNASLDFAFYQNFNKTLVMLEDLHASIKKHKDFNNDDVTQIATVAENSLKELIACMNKPRNAISDSDLDYIQKAATQVYNLLENNGKTTTEELLETAEDVSYPLGYKLSLALSIVAIVISVAVIAACITFGCIIGGTAGVLLGVYGGGFGGGILTGLSGLWCGVAADVMGEHRDAELGKTSALRNNLKTFANADKSKFLLFKTKQDAALVVALRSAQDAGDDSVMSNKL